MDLALGSAPAGIGPTIPAMAAASVVLGQPPAPGSGPEEEALLAPTLPASVVTSGTGRTAVPRGIVRPVIPAAFLSRVVVP